MNTHQNATDQVRASLTAVLKQESAIADDTRLIEDLGIDSTAVIELLLDLEERTGIEIDPDELGSGVFESVESLTAFVESKSPGEAA